MRGRRFAHQFAHIERLSAFRDVGQQNIHKRMLSVECRSTLVLGSGNSLNRRQIELAEGVVLRAKQTSPFSIGLPRIDPTIHDPPAYECLYPLGPIPAMKQKSIHVVRRFIDFNFCQWHCGSYRSVSSISMTTVVMRPPLLPPCSRHCYACEEIVLFVLSEQKYSKARPWSRHCRTALFAALPARYFIA
jgi:hypothetical protein